MATQTTITEAERAERRQMVDEIRASSALEGGRSSDQVHAIQDRWVEGEITLDEMDALILELHPTTNPQ